mgnify:CR=1 FL=1
MRALRAARQACELNFKINEDTVILMRACRGEIKSEPQERIFNELQRALKTKKTLDIFPQFSESGFIGNLIS